MKAMILAAGRGERMRPLTDALPKPLQPVGDSSLIEHHIVRLVAAGFTELVINVSWLGETIQQKVGDGSPYGANIQWSVEPAGALETGGALQAALPLLGPEPFVLVNGDVWTDYPFATLMKRELKPAELVHLVLVPNPERNPKGDFAIHGGHATMELFSSNSHTLEKTPLERFTYSGIGIYRPALLALHNGTDKRFPLAPLLREAMATQRVTAELYNGDWRDIGTVACLRKLQGEQSA